MELGACPRSAAEPLGMYHNTTLCLSSLLVIFFWRKGTVEAVGVTGYLHWSEWRFALWRNEKSNGP